MKIFAFGTAVFSLLTDICLIEARINDPSRGRKLLDTDAETVTIYEGLWGDWNPWVHGSPGKYACGAQIRYEWPKEEKDSTGANGLRMAFCDINDWNQQEIKTIHDGLWGDWLPLRMCPSGKYITAASVVFTDHKGGNWFYGEAKTRDDTALNRLRIKCATLDGSGTESDVVVNWDNGHFKPWVYATSGKFVKGASVRFQSDQGGSEWGGGDDTAMNGIKFIADTPNKHSDSGNSCPRLGVKWITVSNDGELLGVQMNTNNIFRSKIDARDWTQVGTDSNMLNRISVSGDGNHMWGVNRNHAIYKWDGAKFVGFPNGRLKQVAVTNNGDVWGVNKHNKIYFKKHDDDKWTQIGNDSTMLKYISASPNGQHIWGVNKNDAIYYWDGAKFVWFPNGRLKQIAVTDNGDAWGVNANDNVYHKLSGDEGWKQIGDDSTMLSHISVNGDGNQVWGVNKSGAIYYFNGDKFVAPCQSYTI